MNTVADLVKGDDGARREDGGPRGGRFFGIALSELDAGLREEFQIEPDVRGLLVLSADLGSVNERALRPGDVIEQIGFQDVRSILDARVVIERAAIGERALVLKINRDGRCTYRRIVTRG